MYRIIHLSLLTAILALGTLYSFCQNRWVKVYHDEEDAPMKFLIESYDKGYLLAGKHGANYSKYNWLIKTDINGETLWEKTIGDGINSIVFLDMAQENSRSTYLGGSTKTYDPEGDPLIMKLDSCGEKQWCRIFYTENNHDFSSCLTLTPNGEAVVVLNLTNPEPWFDRICIAKLSAEGELVWKQCYTSADTCQRNEESFDIIRTPDSGYLVTGFCYYEDPIYPNHWLFHPYYLKVDSLGNFEWETVVFKETNQEGGIAWTSVTSPNGQYYYSSISHHFFKTDLRSPSLVKIDLQGNVTEIYDIVNGYKYGKLTYAQFLNDSTLAAEAGWGNIEDSVWSRAVIIDTLGNLLNSTILIEDLYTSILQVTYDGKLLYGSNTYQNNEFDAYLTKLNQNLEDDSLYTMPYNYDSLCPYQIISDTIVQDDCELIVGIEEEKEKGGRGEEGRMVVWPNPGDDIINFRLSIFDCRFSKDYKLLIYDVFGRKVEEIALTADQEEMRLNVSGYPQGIYFAVVRNKSGAIGSAKFLVVN